MADAGLEKLLEVCKEYTCYDSYVYNLQKDESDKECRLYRWLVIMTKLPVELGETLIKTNDNNEDRENAVNKHFALFRANALKVIKIIDIFSPTNEITQIICRIQKNKEGHNVNVKYGVNEIVKSMYYDINQHAVYSGGGIHYVKTLESAYYNRKMPNGFTGKWLNINHWNGHILSKQYFKNSKRNGSKIVLSDKGEKISKEIYRNGKLTLNRQEWHENGIIKYKRKYDTKTKIVVERTWFKNGQIQTSGTKKVRGGIKGTKRIEGYIGDFLEWYENGIIKEKTKYNEQGDILSSQKWYKNGQHRSEYIYSNKEGATGIFATWYENGKISLFESYDGGGNSKGFAIEWFSNGQIKSICDYKYRKKDGICITWNENKESSAITEYSENITTWYLKKNETQNTMKKNIKRLH